MLSTNIQFFFLKTNLLQVDTFYKYKCFTTNDPFGIISLKFNFLKDLNYKDITYRPNKMGWSTKSKKEKK